MIKHVFLDLDDTILDFHRSERESLAEALASLGLEPTDTVLSRYSAINRSRWELLERGEITRHEVLISRFAILFSEFGMQIDPEVAQEAYESRLSESCHFLDGAVDLLDALSGDFHLYLASNGNARVQKGRLAKANISHYFDGIFVSEAIGANKPAKEFFDYALNAAGNPDRSECVMVGDSLSSDILGGINAGMRTVWFNREEKPKRADITPTYEIKNLAELPALLKSIK